ncbi:MAG TPA: ATP-dependent helicase [Candidatus Limnocylindria bacterium]|nr:ATP-dependent helicase [Candidatus Limnocylindria bacterium]
MPRDYQLNPFRSDAPLRIDYAGELNPQQLAAVTAAPGPALVLAGAGAGKTRTLTYRVAWLIEQGIPAERILLLTFTNKSAREMMQRVGDLLGGSLSQLWGGTFHSVGNRILRRHADRLGYRQDFTIADREDAKDLLAACITDAGVDVKATRFPKPEVLGDIFSMALNTGRTVPALLEADYESFLPLAEVIADVQRRYAARKRTAGLMDFDDLLVLWLRLLREHADVGELYQRRFQFVLVDEYQDTNILQAELLDTLAKRHHNLMAVGDDAQSIYSWRGANFANILNFPQRYAGAQVFKIETNYRSTPEILALANAAIAANTRQFPKALLAARPSGPKPVLVVCGEGGEQAAFIAQRALELRDEGQRLDEMCVLYRSHFHALELQLELTRRNIPFTITSGIRFFEQAHIKDVAAYLKLVANPQDELALKRLVRMLPGIGSKGADKLYAAFSARLGSGVSGFGSESQGMGGAVPDSGSKVGGLEVVAQEGEARFSDLRAAAAATEEAVISDNDGGDGMAVAEVPIIPIAPLLTAIARSVPGKAAAAWAQFTATISQCEGDPIRNAPGRFIRLVVEADYEDYLKATYENPRNRLDDLEQLANYADQFSSVGEFLSQLALQTNVEAEENQPRDEDEERLKLSTVHQAKGLEFGTVFVIMLCDGLFPSQRSLDSTEGEEEERRLFYVAVTRARNELYLCHPLLRFMQGGGNALQQPSRFLGELPKELVDEWNLRPTFNAYPIPKAAAPPPDDFLDEPDGDSPF